MDATDRQRDAEGREGRGGGRGGGEGGRGEGEETDIKSNNPHLTGGELLIRLNFLFLQKADSPIIFQKKGDIFFLQHTTQKIQRNYRTT